jgi:hypothetical protein
MTHARGTHPSTTPLEQWRPAWLKFACADILDAAYITATDAEKSRRGWPVTRDEMVTFVRQNRRAA